MKLETKFNFCYDFTF